MTPELWTRRPDTDTVDFGKDECLWGWYRRVPFDEAVERMETPFCRILSDLFDLDGRVTAVHDDEGWRREAKEELLRAALGEGT